MFCAVHTFRPFVTAESTLVTVYKTLTRILAAEDTKSICNFLGKLHLYLELQKYAVLITIVDVITVPSAQFVADVARAFHSCFEITF